MSFLPGMFPGGAMAQALKLSQVLSATDNDGAAFTLPVGIQAGDLIVVFDAARQSSDDIPSSAVPSGFTAIANRGLADVIGGVRAVLSYKLADGSEGGASVNGMEADGNNPVEGKATYVFRGSRPIESVGIGDPEDAATGGNPGAQTVGASIGAAPLVVIAAYCCGGDALDAVNPRTFNPAKDGEINVNHNALDLWLAFKIYNSSPANVAVDMDDESDVNILASCYFACA